MVLNTSLVTVSKVLKNSLFLHQRYSHAKLKTSACYQFSILNQVENALDKQS